MTKQKKRQWQTGNDIRLSTMHYALKEPRDYVFKEINQEFGSRIFWKYVLVIVQQWPKVKDKIKGSLEKIKTLRSEGKDADGIIDNVGSVLDIFVDVLPSIFTWDAISEMAELLLADHTVEIEGEKLTADSKGFVGASGDPLELFNALFFAMCVNWPKYFSPLLGLDLKDLTRDSGPVQKQSEAEENSETESLK